MFTYRLRSVLHQVTHVVDVRPDPLVVEAMSFPRTEASSRR